MDQREVWEKIAPEWDKYRTHRREEAISFLQNKTGLVLDLGCANGRNFTRIDGTIVGVDFSENMLKFAGKKAKDGEISAFLARGDALSLPFADDSFDAVLFANTLPSIKYNRHGKVMKEIVRVAKNKAAVFVSVWNRDQPRFRGARRESFVPWRAEGSKYERYYCLYSKDDMKALMKKYFTGVRVFGSSEKAFKRYPKNIIAIARVAKSGQRRKA
jgi:ubiquinone/menaquinone biosynthesis C-methylase UbiE